MSMGEICQVCETKPATHTCGNCGTLACDDHYDSEHDLCTQCASSLDGSGDVDTPDLDGSDLGHDDLR